MTFRKIHNNIRYAFQSRVVSSSDNLGTSDVAWDNTGFNTHDAGDGGAWVRLTILNSESEVINLGSTNLRTAGIIVSSIFVPAEQGDKLGLTIADEVVSAFNSKTIELSGNTVITRNPTVASIGRDGSWYQINVSIPFHSDHAT